MKNTKKALLLASIASLAYACSSTPKDKWEIDFDITDATDSDQLKISYLAENKKDTIIPLKNGKADFCVPYVDPTWVTISLSRDGINAQNEVDYSLSTFINASGEKLTITSSVDSLKRAQPKGGMYELESFDTLRKLNAITYSLQDDYTKSLVNNDAELKAKVMESVKENWHRTISTILYFAEKNPDLFYSAYLVSFISREIPLEDLKVAYGKLSDRIKEHEIGKNIKNTIDIAEKSVREGKELPDFTFVDTEGKNFSFSDYRGKWLLIDFWGSWCSPCRMTNPSLVEMYKKYNSRGFEIVGIAVNDSQERVKNAMIEDNISWKNASMDVQNDSIQVIPMLFNITAVPTKVLVNPNGVVELVEAGGAENSPIIAKLKEVFGK
ncbi:MAG: TlpA disulfide reductase family protein [Flavobacteriales bacterium]|nr:TlpA disulfide reductase family protein [Flavobacteriales bacterium]